MYNQLIWGGNMIKYPKLVINMKHFKNNFEIVQKMCQSSEIDFAFVIKGFNGLVDISKEVSTWGCKEIASSRMDQLIDLKKAGVSVETMLLRLPMMSELQEVIEYADISLNSQRETLMALNEVALSKNKVHKVILLRDLGDLREGIFSKDKFIETASFVESLEGLHLEGVGTALSCYGSTFPTIKNLSELVANAREIEGLIGRKLKYVSGGSSTSLNLLKSGTMPEGINHLRIAEAIICTLDLPLNWETEIDGLNKNVFTLHAQVIEIEHKPTLPIGKKGVNAFGEVPYYEDKGIRKRMILAIGNKDVGNYSSIIPLDSDITLVGASSDHLIVDIEESKKDYKIGDILTFNMFYQAILFSSNSNCMTIEVLD